METGLRKVCRFIDRFIGVFYATSIYCGFHILTNGFNVTDEWKIIVLPFWLLTGIHWVKTRKPRITYDELGHSILYMERPYLDRSVFNPVERYRNIATNQKIPVITLVKGNKVKVEQDGQKSTRTVEQLGMTGKNGKPVYNWTMTQKFALNKGYYDFKDDVNWTVQKERAKVRKRLEVFRKQLSISLGLPDFELGEDYTYWNGVFEWKSIVWRDASVPQWKKEEVTKMDNVMRKNVAGAWTKASIANPDIEDVDLYEHRE